MSGQNTTDYDLPPDYEARVAEGTMSEWYTRERCRRMAVRQDNPAIDHLERIAQRYNRRIGARSETISLEEMR